MILLMGIAGSGKGTQGKMLADDRGFHLISMGEVLRMYVTGEQRKKMLSGGLLDDKEIITIVDKVLATIPDHEEVLMDGFPRTIPQAEWLLEQIKQGRFELKQGFHLVASEEAVKARLMNRGRIDDTEEAIAARFQEYQRQTHPLITWLRDHDINIIDIDAERSAETVNEEIVQFLDKS